MPGAGSMGPAGLPRPGPGRARHGRGRGRGVPLDRAAGVALRQRLQRPGAGGVPAGGLQRDRPPDVRAVLVAVADLAEVLDDGAERVLDLLELTRGEAVDEVPPYVLHV